jgi:hypothetical protein
MHEERTTQHVAWAAGLFEGEGCWNAYVRKGGKVQMQVRLEMTDKDVVERFAAIVGCGAIHLSQPGTGGHKPLPLVVCLRGREGAGGHRAVPALHG